MTPNRPKQRARRDDGPSATMDTLPTGGGASDEPSLLYAAAEMLETWRPEKALLEEAASVIAAARSAGLVACSCDARAAAEFAEVVIW